MTSITPHRSSAAVCFALILFHAAPVHAAITPGGNVTPAYNGVADPWDVGGDLAVGDTTPGWMLITGGSDVTNASSYLGKAAGATGSVRVQHSGSTWQQGGVMHVGSYGSGTLEIWSGGVVSSSTGYIGYALNSTGNVLISGAGSTWNASGVEVGRVGTGTLRIEFGGRLSSWFSSIGANSTATVTGTGSVWDVKGSLGIGGTSGALYVENNGSVQVNNDTTIRVGSSGSGRIELSNATFTTKSLLASPAGLRGVGIVNTENWVSDFDLIFDQSHGQQQQFYFNNLPGQNITLNLDTSGQVDPFSSGTMGAGYSASGSLTIAGGSVVNTANGHLGYLNGSNGTATVNGAGSRWDNNFLHVGTGGTGSLTVQNGGAVTSNSSAYIGEKGTSVGTVTVTGPGSSWEHLYRMVVGSEGVGTLNIEEGGFVSSGEVVLGEFNNGAGAVNLSGGTFRAGSIYTQNGNATFNFTGGRLEGIFSIDVGQPFLQSGGIIAPHSEYGFQHARVKGDYTLAVGAVEIRLGGNNNPYDQLTATGGIDIALLGTTLDLLGIGPMAAGTYTVIESTGGTLTGMFEHVAGIAMYPGLVDVSYTANAVRVTLNWDYVPGDLDGDGFVGIADLNFVLGNWNQDVTPYDLLLGDVTGDGFVGIEDLNAVLGNWNTGTPPPAEVLASVPEPGVLVVLGVGLAGGVNRRNRGTFLTEGSAATY